MGTFFRSKAEKQRTETCQRQEAADRRAAKEARAAVARSIEEGNRQIDRARAESRRGGEPQSSWFW